MMDHTTTLPFRITLDRTGFPMVKPDGLDFYISWLPVTKIQFEQFMCDTNLLNNAWYQDILSKYTPRVAPGLMTLGDYWNIFMTGILPAEAVRFADWMGRDFRLPTAKEWKDALNALARQPAMPDYVEAVATYDETNAGKQRSTSQRAALICRRLDTIPQPDQSQLVQTDGRRLCDQMMMRLGVVEYVYENEQRNTFVGWGQPNRRFLGGIFNPMVDTKPISLVNKNTGSRMKHFGFRLIRGEA